MSDEVVKQRTYTNMKILDSIAGFDDSLSNNQELSDAEKASLRILALAKYYDENNISCSPNMFKSEANYIISQTRTEKEEKNKWFKNDVTVCCLNKLNIQENFSEETKENLKAFYKAYPTTISYENIKSKVMKEFASFYDKYEEKMWDTPDLKVDLTDFKVNLGEYELTVNNGQRSFEAGFENIYREVREKYSQYGGIDFREKFWIQDHYDNLEGPDDYFVKSEPVSSERFSIRVYNDVEIERYEDERIIMDPVTGIERSLTNLELAEKILHQEKLENMKEIPSIQFVGKVIPVKERKEISKSILDGIEKEGLSYSFNGRAVAERLPEYEEAYNGVRNAYLNSVSLKFDVIKSAALGPNPLTALEEGVQIVKVNGQSYSVPVIDACFEVYQLDEAGGNRVGEPMTFSDYAETYNLNQDYEVVEKRGISDNDFKLLANDLVEGVYEDGDGQVHGYKDYVIDASIKELKEEIDSKNLNSKYDDIEYYILGNSDYKLIDAERINQLVKEQVLEVYNNGTLRTSIVPLVTDDYVNDTILNYYEKYSEKEIDEGFINEGAGLFEVIAKTSEEIVNEQEKSYLEQGFKVYRKGEIDKSYEDMTNIDLKPLYQKAVDLVEDISKNPEDYEQFVDQKNGGIVTAFKKAEITVGDITYSLSVNPDFVYPEKHIAVAEDLVTQFVNHYIEEYGYHDNVDEIPEFTAEDDVLIFSEKWKNQKLLEVEYFVDLNDTQKVSEIKFPSGVVLKADFEKYPENKGFNPKFVRIDVNNEFLISPIFASSSSALGLQMKNLDPNDYAFKYECVKKFTDMHNEELVLKQVNGTSKLGPKNLDVNHDKHINVDDYGEYVTKTYNENNYNENTEFVAMINDVDEALNEKMNFNTNKFDDREIQGKEYAGNGFYDSTLYIPIENQHTRDLMFNVKIGDDDNKEWVKELNGDYTYEGTKFMLNYAEDGSYMPKALMLKNILAERANILSDEMKASDALRFIRNHYSCLNDYYKGLINPVKGKHYYSTVYSKDAIVDAMLNIELKHLAVCYSKLEEHNKPYDKKVIEQIGSAELTVFDAFESMKYFKNFSTDDMIGIVKNYVDRNGAVFKGSESVISNEYVSEFEKNSSLSLAEKEELKLKYLESIVEDCKPSKDEDQVTILPREYYKGYVKFDNVTKSVQLRDNPDRSVALAYNNEFYKVMNKELFDARSNFMNGKPIGKSLEELKTLADVAYTAKQLSEVYKPEEMILVPNIEALHNFVSKDNNSVKIVTDRDFIQKVRGVINIVGIKNEKKVVSEITSESLGKKADTTKELLGNLYELYHINDSSSKEFKSVLTKANMKIEDYKAIRHVLRYAYPGMDVMKMDKDDFIASYNCLMNELAGKYDNGSKAYMDTVLKEFNNPDYKTDLIVKDFKRFIDESDKMPAMGRTLALAKCYGLSKDIEKMSDGKVVTEKFVQELITNHEDKMFSLNNGPVSDIQKEFLEKFGMKELLNSKSLNYLVARNVIIEKLKNEKIIEPQYADYISSRIFVSGLGEDVLYTVKPGIKSDEKALASLNNKLKRICNNHRDVECQYKLDNYLINTSDGVMVESPAFKNLPVEKQVIVKVCKELEEETGKTSKELSGSVKLYTAVAEAILRKDLVMYDNNNRFLAAEVQNEFYTNVLDHIVAGGLKPQNKEKCIQVFEKVRDKFEAKGLIRHVPRMAENIKNNNSRGKNGPQLGVS